MRPDKYGGENAHPAGGVTIAAALDAATRRLAAAGIETPRLDAEVLLRDVLGLDRAALFLRLHEILPPAERASFAGLVERRLAGEPVAYLVGEREFFGLPLAVGPGVLVPRPETEVLVEWALAWLAAHPNSTVVDVGTGSGAIALALTANLPAGDATRIVAADVSSPALAYAWRNRARRGVAGRVALVRGDLLTWCGGPIDLLLANLPYLRPEQAAANPELRAEPDIALLGGADGLELLHRLIADAPRVLAPGGAIGLELDPTQAAIVGDLLAETFPRARVEILRDLAGLTRHVVATGC